MLCDIYFPKLALRNLVAAGPACISVEDDCFFTTALSRGFIQLLGALWR